jgi:DNA-binding transcriptional regulator LsrR (DeoR family)
MRGSEWDKAKDEERQGRILRDAIVLGFKHGWSRAHIANRYEMLEADIDDILRDALRTE